MIPCFRFLFVVRLIFRERTEPFTLSLHDALPISSDVKLDPSGSHEPQVARLKPARPKRSTSVNRDLKSTRLNSSHEWISYAVFCLKKKRLLRFLSGTKKLGVLSYAANNLYRRSFP